jgi:hypothetical protein
MTRRLIASTILATLCILAAGPLAAQDRPEEARPRCNNLRALAKFVQLTEEQAGQAKIIFQALHETVVPLHEQLIVLKEELAALLAGENPPPGLVGQLVVDIKGLQDEIQNAKNAATNEFLALLTEEQLELYAEFQEICRRGFDVCRPGYDL